MNSMKKLILPCIAVLMFAACTSRHHDVPKEISTDSTSIVKVDSITEPAPDSTNEQKFYSEMFYKRNLEFGPWKDSTIETSEGEGINPYTLPIKIQHGSTTNFLFLITSWYEYYEKDQSENKNYFIQFKLRSSPTEGKTLEEDKKLRELYGWNNFYENLDQLKSYLPEPEYPKKFIHKK